MARKVFYSFYYKSDGDRASQVRNMGIVEGNQPAKDNDWEQVKKGGDPAIKKWIDDQLYGRSCCIVLIGHETAGRKWVKYEIEKSWNEGKGLMGIFIHNLKDLNGNQSTKGANPFESFNVNALALSSIVKAYDPPSTDSKTVYSHIKSNLSGWIDEAIRIRAAH